MLAIGPAHFFIARNPAAAVNHKKNGKFARRELSALVFVVDYVEFTRFGHILVVNYIFDFGKFFTGKTVAKNVFDTIVDIKNRA